MVVAVWRSETAVAVNTSMAVREDLAAENWLIAVTGIIARVGGPHRRVLRVGGIKWVFRRTCVRVGPEP